MAICRVKDTENIFKMQMDTLSCILFVRFINFANNQSLFASKVNNYQLNNRSNLWETKKYEIRRANYNAELLL